MNYIYPAVFYPEDNGRYSAIFPDLNNLATFGDDLAHAYRMAQEACALYLFTSLHDGEDLPDPTPVEAVKKDADVALVDLIHVDLDDFAERITIKE